MRWVPWVPKTVAIVGVGHIGGSLAMALRGEGVEVIGVDPDAQVLARAAARGAVDRGFTAPDAVREAEVVILAAPLEATAEVARAVMSSLRPGTLVTDVGSVKGPIVRAVEPLAQAAGVHFVGGHPMFGTEGQGVEVARAELLKGARFIVTPTEHSDPGAVERLCSLANALGMTPLRMSPEEHDRAVAGVSHLPYVLAVALTRSTTSTECAGPAFRDMTRVAASPVEMWQEILSLNRSSVNAALEALIVELEALRSLDGQALRQALEDARRRRTDLNASRPTS
jgi:prephenate dehydrogenase